MAKHRVVPGEANIPIELDGEERELTPSLDACLKVSRISGGMTAAVERIRNGDFDTICAVIAAGLDENVTRKLQDKIFRTGIFQLQASAIRFITVVNNGGRPADRLEEEEEDDDEDEDSSEEDESDEKKERPKKKGSKKKGS